LAILGNLINGYICESFGIAFEWGSSWIGVGIGMGVGAVLGSSTVIRYSPAAFFVEVGVALGVAVGVLIGGVVGIRFDLRMLDVTVVPGFLLCILAQQGRSKIGL